MEIFYSIQGEGLHSGVPSIFIRLAGCDIGCHWCDVKDSWSTEGFPKLSLDEINNKISDFSSKNIIITGGEPLMYNLNELTEFFKSKGKTLHIETSGAYNISGHWDWFCLSPKKIKLPTQKAYEICDELKIIVYNNDDFSFAIDQAKLVGKNCKLFLQPEWSKKEQMNGKIFEFVKQKPNWNLSLQTHKYIDVP